MIHRRHQSLPSPTLHLLQVAPLRIFVHAQDIERDDGFKVDRHLGMERASESVLVDFAQCLWRLNRRIGNFLVIFDGLEGGLCKILSILSSEQLRLLALVVGVFRAWDKSEDSRNSESYG